MLSISLALWVSSLFCFFKIYFELYLSVCGYVPVCAGAARGIGSPGAGITGS